METSVKPRLIKTGDVRVRVIRDHHPCNPREDDNMGTMVCWHSRYDLGDYTNNSHHNGVLYGDSQQNPHERPEDLFLSILLEVEEAATAEIIKPIIEVLIADDDVAADYIDGRPEDAKDYNDADLGFIEDQIQYGASREVRQALLGAARKVATIMPLGLYDHSGLSIYIGGKIDRWDSSKIGWIYVTHKKVAEEQLTVEKMEKYLTGEVKTYDMYLKNDMWGYVVEKAEVCKCCGRIEWEDEEDGSCWGFYGTDFDNGMADNIDEEHHELLRAALADPEI